MRAAAPTAVRANGCEIRFSRTRRGNNGNPAIPESIADRLALIKLFVSIAAKNAEFNLRGVRFVILPTLLTKPYLLRFQEALTSYCGLLQQSIVESARLFADNEKVTRLARITRAAQDDGFHGIEIHFGLNRGLVTFQYIQADGAERKTPHPPTPLI